MDGQKVKQCEQQSYVTDSGIAVSGHMYMALECILDEEHNRYYFVDQCKHCGNLSAAYIDADKPLAKTLVALYDSQHNVAGIANGYCASILTGGAADTPTVS